MQPLPGPAPRWMWVAEMNDLLENIAILNSRDLPRSLKTSLKSSSVGGAHPETKK
jgi:hypothetical protein